MSKLNKGGDNKGGDGVMARVPACPACKRKDAPVRREPKGGDLKVTDVHRARCMWCKAKLIGRYVIRWEQDDRDRQE
jgi:hypothetical protein